MRRFLFLLLNEFRLSRTALVVHLIAVLQPTLMYALMASIMVVPTFDMLVVRSDTELAKDLTAAMDQVGSPIGPNYIHPVLVAEADPGHRQVIELVNQDQEPVAFQRFGYIDSNLVKNLRNRLTAALLALWNERLGSRAVTVNQHPWLPRDVPYAVYFGMAMIPLAAYLAAAMIGGYLMAQEFEQGTILEYRLSPVSAFLLLAAKLTRLLLTGLLAASFLYITLGLVTGFWSSSVLAVCLLLLPLTLIAACIGLLAGMLTRSSLPSFLIGLASAFVFWLIGSGFGLAAGFSPLFERISRLIPNTVVIELIFPYYYYGRQVAANPAAGGLQLAGCCLVLGALVVLVYRQRVLNMEP
ncbi:MAG: ABC transporter permease [Anaerolineales bacterium]|nr:ABC transporter permease [Anaerolineales bacterium]